MAVVCASCSWRWLQGTAAADEEQLSGRRPTAFSLGHLQRSAAGPNLAVIRGQGVSASPPSPSSSSSLGASLQSQGVVQGSGNTWSRSLLTVALYRACLVRGVRRRAEPESRGLAECPPPVLYQQRWVQLAFLAMLALLSDLVCFSVAATPGVWKTTFNQDPATLIDIFLFTNVFSCFIEPYAINKFGLRIPIVAAACLMAVGCLFRSGLPFMGGEIPGYSTVVAGTMMVAVAQPFFQCTPPLLSATWFAPDERALSTAVAINFNQVGIATAFLAGGLVGGTTQGLQQYFCYISVAAIVVALGALFFFQERPPTPPSASELEKAEAQNSEGASQLKDSDYSFTEQAGELIRTPGFVPPLTAFVTSIAVTNVVGAFMDQKLEQVGFTDQNTVDFAGAGFELAIVVGGIILGGIVDRNKEYKAVTLACLSLTLVGVLLLGFDKLPRNLALVALLAIGGFAGPVQPINAELAVEVTFPADENAIEAVQQLCGNLVSALLVPLCEAAAEIIVPLPGVGSLRGDTVVLLALLSTVTVYFSTFSAPLRRTEVDKANCVIDEGEGASIVAKEELAG